MYDNWQTNFEEALKEVNRVLKTLDQEGIPESSPYEFVDCFYMWKKDMTPTEIAYQIVGDFR